MDADANLRLQRLERENETLRALLLLNNVKVVFEERDASKTETTFTGDAKTLGALAAVRSQLSELRAQYLLARADVMVLREQLDLTLSELRRLTSMPR